MPPRRIVYGLVNEVVEPARLMERARELAAQLMENSPSSMRSTKQLINGYIAEQLDHQITSGSTKTMRGFGRRPTFAKASRRFSKNANRAGVESERGKTFATARSVKAECECATPRPIRWVWSITANHFIWFEIGRVDFMRQLGLHLSRHGTRSRMLHPGSRRALPLQGSGAV